MKADDLRPILKCYADALNAAGAGPCADAVRALVKLLDGSRWSRFAELPHAYQAALSSQENGIDSFAKLSSSLSGLKNLLACAGSQALSRQLQLLLDAIDEQSQRAPERPVEAVASASNPRRKKGTASVDRQLVEEYLQRLGAVLGDDTAFEKVYGELLADARVTRVEAVAIASGFVGGVPPSTSRPKALQRIRYRHDKLKDFKSASKLIARGKTAA